MLDLFSHLQPIVLYLFLVEQASMIEAIHVNWISCVSQHIPYPTPRWAAKKKRISDLQC